ncbi:hypothetical protein DFJ73DRAFT_770219 [Zopfochytrium polystomum]|nr:hypothetical protein DFJ73DRAFT_770219 [Zopfochytrium polystomum]
MSHGLGRFSNRQQVPRGAHQRIVNPSSGPRAILFPVPTSALPTPPPSHTTPNRHKQQPASAAADETSPATTAAVGRSASNATSSVAAADPSASTAAVAQSAATAAATPLTRRSRYGVGVSEVRARNEMGWKAMMRSPERRTGVAWFTVEWMCGIEDVRSSRGYREEC